MTPKWGPIENSFKPIKHHTKVNAYTKFGSNRPKIPKRKIVPTEIAKSRRYVDTIVHKVCCPSAVLRTSHAVSCFNLHGKVAFNLILTRSKVMTDM